jgi:hypothetical protein
MKTKQKPARSTPTVPAISETPGASVTPALSLFTEAAIVIASFTIVGYLWALSYEVAFFRYFSIPFYFITLNPTAVFSPPYIFFLLNGDMELYRNSHFFV